MSEIFKAYSYIMIQLVIKGDVFCWMIAACIANYIDMYLHCADCVDKI